MTNAETAGADLPFPAGAVLVFGGSGGIGGAVAREFGRAGSDVAVTYRGREAAAAERVAEIEALGRSASAIQVDVRDAASVEAALTSAVARHGRVHTIVFAAGPIVPQVHVSRITAAQWRDAIATEVDGFFNVVQAALPVLRAAGGGSFVHIGSAGDRLWPVKDGLSVIPKAANEALVRGIAREEGRFCIRANSVLVGVVEGGMFEELNRTGGLDQAWHEATLRLLALKRYGRPEEIGHAAVFLASSRAAYVTGEQISVSGGLGV